MKPILTLLLCLVCASAQADKLVTGNRVDRVRVNNLVSLVLRSALPLRFAKNFRSCIIRLVIIIFASSKHQGHGIRPI